MILFSVDKALGQDRKTIEVFTLADRHKGTIYGCVELEAIVEGAAEWESRSHA